MRHTRLVATVLSFGLLLALAGPAAADPLKCKATITKSASQYVQARTKALVKCEGAVVAGKLPQATDCQNELKTSAAIDKAKTKMEAAIEKACGGADQDCGSGGDDDSLTSIGWDIGTCPDLETSGCSMAIHNCHDVSDCLECIDEKAVDQAVTLYYGDLALPSTTDKTLNKCQQTIGKATAAFLATKSKALQKCWDAVNKGAVTGPCPSPGDGKALGAIDAAEAKKIAAICKACGGADKKCDQTVNGPNGTTVPGSGGSDDETPAAIGFPTNCADLTIPGSASCSQPIATLADIVECVDCITEFKVDCADRAAVPWGTGYPGECNPGCGNNILEPGEVCDGTADAACPGHCAPAILADGCTCPTGSFRMDGVPGADLDTGWTGIAHNQGALSGKIFDADTYGCSSAGPDKSCTFVARYDTPFFGAPLPLSSGGVPICVVNQVNGVTNGTFNLVTGDLDYDYSLISHVYSGITVDQPCPRCDGDVTFDDGVKNGTCTGGPQNGSSCDADGQSASFGFTSFDCMPDSGSSIGNLAIVFDDATTGTKSISTSAASPNCTGAAGPKCFCDTCNNADNTACFSNADCPPSGGNPGICGGKRCLGGANGGAPCSAASECPSSACSRPGTPTKPNGCVDDTTIPGDGTVCVDIGGGQGQCPEGPIDSNCAAPEQFRGCTPATQVTDCPITHSCVSANRACFPSTVTRTGTPGPTSGAYVGEFCIAPTGAAAVNNVAGLPGLGALILPYTVSVNVP